MPTNQITIGATTTNLVLVTGAVSKPQDVVQEVTRPGVDGIAYKKEATRGGRFRLRCMVDTSNLTTLTATIKGFRGQVASSIYDEHGLEHTNILIEEVTPPRIQRAVTLNGFLADATSTHVVRFELQCRDTKIT